MTKFIKDQLGKSSETKPRLFTCLNRANDIAKFDCWGGKKLIVFFVCMVWWHGYRDYRGFSNSHLWGTDQKSCSF